jgi:hypothetical protein
MNIAIGHDFCCVWELNVGPLQDAAAAAAHAKDKLMQRQEKLEVTVASRLQLISLVFFASPYSEQYQTCNSVCLFFFTRE